ncbi:sulfatase-like hydrolase/transferase [bacterium]|nr:sulfatase-like hydrolase/transferase [bacterium]
MYDDSQSGPVANASPGNLCLCRSLGLVCCLTLIIWLGLFPQTCSAQPQSRPNVILIYADDLGYGDITSQGAKGFQTPQINRLQKLGTRFTNFYVAQPVCTASRAALFTGCYSHRVGLAGALNHTSQTGINPEEFLLSELFKANGYATAIYGKWHLGHQPPFLPTRNGFDEFFGIPYSNDNGPLHPVIRDIPSLPLYENERVIALDPDQSQFTKWLTERSVQFIERHREEPFFLYVPHIMPHVPIFASDDYRGRTEHGLYGDVVEELDHGIGQIIDAVQAAGIAEKTWIIFASDNGPFLSYGEHAGSSGVLREGKLTTFEGGVRVPCVMVWPGQIPAGRVCADPMMTIDLLPTMAKLLGTTLPATAIDGRDVWPVISGQKDVKSPHEALYFYSGNELHAVRSGPWKLHFPHEYLTVAAAPGKNGKPSNWENMKPLSITESGIRGIASRHGYRVETLGLSLFNLDEDPGETINVAAQHPDVVRLLTKLAETARQDLGDSLTNRTGTGLRPVGKVE